ncbi:hypothetical protein HNQ79_002347 [Streptomyces candidus]|uniref:Uncharacterized protein n=1 Tax=Streptomyces candidus TaxID=67283 RepID=A0A7X0LPW2_9ACTN|nr:hypothetical protein [Streptomyces candidus]
MPSPCSAHNGHACQRHSVTVSCAASATVSRTEAGRGHVVLTVPDERGAPAH